MTPVGDTGSGQNLHLRTRSPCLLVVPYVLGVSTGEHRAVQTLNNQRKGLNVQKWKEIAHGS